MATSGAAAWQKYFRGKGDIETRLKKDSEVFDVQTVLKMSRGIEVQQRESS